MRYLETCSNSENPSYMTHTGMLVRWPSILLATLLTTKCTRAAREEAFPKQ